MNITHSGNAHSALVKAAISNHQHLGLSQSLRQSQQFCYELGPNARGIAKQ